MKPPIYNTLSRLVSGHKTKFTTPGHKGKIRMKTDNLCKFDIHDSYASGSDTRIADIISKSQDEIAGIFGAARSFYLSSGTQSGIYAALSAVAAPGDTVIVDSECDHSVINAITMLALQPVFLKRSYFAKYSINGAIATEELEAVIGSNTDARLIIITSPDYYGICANVRKAAAMAHEAGMLLIVDESMGTHFNFTKNAPETALECGADIVLHSLSHSLGGFTGQALLHLAQSIDGATLSAIEANLDIYRGEDISSAFLCAAENIIFYAFTNSHKYQVLYREIERSMQLIRHKTDILWLEAEENNGCDVAVTDKLKITLNFSQYNENAIDISELLLKKYAIEADCADKNNIVFSVSLYSTVSEIRRLVNSCLAISKLLSYPTNEDLEITDISETAPDEPRVVMTPYKAFYCSGEWVDIDASIGKVCRRPIYRIPQRTMIIIPGEKISREMADMIKSLTDIGVTIHGIKDNKIEVLTLSDSFYF